MGLQLQEQLSAIPAENQHLVRAEGRRRACHDTEAEAAKTKLNKIPAQKPVALTSGSTVSRTRDA